MPGQLVILPILIPLLAGVINLLAHQQRKVQIAVNVIALLGTLAASLWMAGTL